MAREPVDAVLTDLQMPTMDGLTLITHLLERGLRLPVAVMTGQEIDPALAQRLHEYGIAASFTKPVDVGTLADELQRSLDPETVGRIRGITLFGLLQLLEVERKSALIVARDGESEGRLYFENGTLTHAHVRRLAGAEAVYEILGWIDPAVEIFYRRRARQRSVTEPLQHLLMEAARRLDEHGRAPAQAVTPAQAEQETRHRNDPPAGDADAAAGGVSSESVRTALKEALEIDGALGVALVDAESGMALASATSDGAPGIELAAAAASDIIRAEHRVIEALHRTDVVEDVMITLGTQYHLIAFPRPAHDVFVYLVLERKLANLGMARHQLTRITRRLS